MIYVHSSQSICGEKQWHTVHSSSSGDFGPRHHRNTWPNVRKPRRFYSCFLPEKYFLTVSGKLFPNVCAADHKSLCLLKSIFLIYRDNLTIRMHVPVASDQFVLNRQGLEILNLPRQTQIKLFVKPIHSSFDCIVLIDFFVFVFKQKLLRAYTNWSLIQIILEVWILNIKKIKFIELAVSLCWEGLKALKNELWF